MDGFKMKGQIKKNEFLQEKMKCCLGKNANERVLFKRNTYFRQLPLSLLPRSMSVPDDMKEMEISERKVMEERPKRGKSDDRRVKKQKQIE
jgi:hypothetical protein